MFLLPCLINNEGITIFVLLDFFLLSATIVYRFDRVSISVFMSFLPTCFRIVGFINYFMSSLVEPR